MLKNNFITSLKWLSLNKLIQNPNHFTIIKTLLQDVVTPFKYKKLNNKIKADVLIIVGDRSTDDLHELLIPHHAMHANIGFS